MAATVAPMLKATPLRFVQGRAAGAATGPTLPAFAGQQVPAALRILRWHGGVKFRMLGTKGVEPWYQLGKILAPSDLAAEIEVAEHAGRGERTDIEPRRVGRR